MKNYWEESHEEYLARFVKASEDAKNILSKLKTFDYLIETYESDTIVGCYPVHSFIFSEVKGGDFYQYNIEVSHIYGRMEFFKKEHPNDHERISFGELFESCPEEVQERMLFDLDLFLGL